MKSTEQLNQLTESLAAEIKQGVLPQAIKSRLINNGASEELATKLTRIVKLQGIDCSAHSPTEEITDITKA